MTYTFCIGSNEQPERNLAKARKRLTELFTEVRFAAEEKTEPLCLKRTAYFLNQVGCFCSNLPAEEIKAKFKEIEAEAGRTPEEKQQEIIRLDIDLLSGDDRIYKPADMQRHYVVRGVQSLRGCSDY